MEKITTSSLIIYVTLNLSNFILRKFSDNFISNKRLKQNATIITKIMGIIIVTGANNTLINTL